MNDPTTQAKLLQIFQPNTKITASRTYIRFSYLCLLQQDDDGLHSISLELSVGTNRKNIVTQPYIFLDAIVQHKCYKVSRSFTYDPSIHQIDANNMKICQLLWSQMNDLSIHGLVKLKLIPVQSSVWQQIEPYLLLEKEVELQYYVDSLPLDEQRHYYHELRISNEKIPLVITIEPSQPSNHYEKDQDQYFIIAESLLSLILLPNFELACYKGILYRIPWESAHQLQQFIMLMRAEAGQLLIDQHGLSSFIELALQPLRKHLSIQISDQIASKITQQPMRAMIFLDRIRDRLLVGVEFHYDSLTIQPFQPYQTNAHDEHIVLREREKEAEILLIIQQIKGLQTEGGIIVEGDDDEYYFFSTILPQLKLIAEIHATTAVKSRYVTEQVYPKLSLTWEQKNDWLQYKFSMDGISDDELKQLLAAISEKRKYFKLSHGTLLSLEHPQYNQLIRVMTELGLTYPFKFDDRIPIQKAIPTLLTIDQQDDITLTRNLKSFITNLKHPQLSVSIPEAIMATPRDYQIDGFQWMCNLAQYHLGGILADEMGLGKTLQAIMYVAHQYNDAVNLDQNFLIVCPASLLYNWKQEFEKFAPSCDATVVESHMINEYFKWSQSKIWIVSYQTLRMHHAAIFTKQRFHTVICDEAQTFKNDYTKTAKILSLISSSYRFALTGTPIENRIEELFSLLSFVNPHIFNHKQRWLDIRKEKQKQMAAPFILRRTKADVLQELPLKYESTYAAPLNMDQKKLYLSYLAKLQEDSLKRLDPKRKGERRIKILAGITRLRQICCHPKLFVDSYNGESAKLNQLLQLIEESIKSGRRILVFSQFTSMLQIIATELAVRHYSYFYLDGNTPNQTRLQYVDAFNEGERELFLLSLKAGGTGLNLTGADTVILYDLWWNPAVEQQAADRVHRIGQLKPVHIIRLVAEGTLEDRMLQLQTKKQKLIEEILEPDSVSSAVWTEEELLQLIDMSNESPEQ